MSERTIYCANQCHREATTALVDGHLSVAICASELCAADVVRRIFHGRERPRFDVDKLTRPGAFRSATETGRTMVHVNPPPRPTPHMES